MILDPEKRFIFIKTTKTAGTSLELALSRIASESSIITPTVDEDLRAKVGGRPPRNFLRQASNPMWRNVPLEFHIPPWGTMTFYNHMKLDEVVEQIESEEFTRYFSFGFTRHPIERALSAYTWIVGANPRRFDGYDIDDHQQEFLHMCATNLGSTKDHLVSSRYPGMAVSTIYRYEELPAALTDICGRLNVHSSMLLPLPSAKRGHAEVLGFDRRALLNKDAVEIIQRVCAWELETFYS